MSAPVMQPPAPEAERLERLEASLLRSPTPAWPPTSPEEAVTVEMPARGTPEQPGEPDAWLSQFRTYGLCCKH
jgi:hypothetical protein